MARWRGVVALVCGWLSAICMTGMMLVTVADVALRSFANIPVRGTVEIVELLLAGAFFLALPATFLRDENIVVDIIDRAVGERGVALLKRMGALLAAVTLGVMAWQGAKLALDAWTFGDVTPDLMIPRIYYWAPVLIGIAASAVVAVSMLLVRSGRS